MKEGMELLLKDAADNMGVSDELDAALLANLEAGYVQNFRHALLLVYTR